MGLVYSNILMLIILYFFLTISIWKFFLIYEASVLPIMLLIMGWGSNPSRFKATFYFFGYTIIISLPIVSFLIFNWKWFSIIRLKSYFGLLFNIGRSYILFFIFLIKIPVYFFHYWLPKAHVEASTFGSIILAGGLLKIGTIGFLKIIIWLKMNVNYRYFIFSAIVSSTLSLIQSDLKKLIAIISVAHMSIRVRSLVTSTIWGLSGFWLENVLHTLSSPLIFYFSGIIIILSKTRLIYFIGWYQIKIFTYLVLITLMANLGVPPFFSILSEIVIISRVFINMFYTVPLLCVYLLTFLILNLFILNLFKFKSRLQFKLACSLNLSYFLVLMLVLIFVKVLI